MVDGFHLRGLLLLKVNLIKEIYAFSGWGTSKFLLPGEKWILKRKSFSLRETLSHSLRQFQSSKLEYPSVEVTESPFANNHYQIFRNIRFVNSPGQNKRTCMTSRCLIISLSFADRWRVAHCILDHSDCVHHWYCDLWSAGLR